MPQLKRKWIRQSRIFLWIRIALAQCIVFLPGVLLALVLHLLNVRMNWIVGLFLVLLLLDILMIAYLYLSWLSINYLIEPGLITIRRGVLNVQEQIYKTAEILAVRVIQSPIGRAFNYGTIEFEYPPHQTISLINVDTPHEHERLINNEISMAESR